MPFTNFAKLLFTKPASLIQRNFHIDRSMELLEDSNHLKSPFFQFFMLLIVKFAITHSFTPIVILCWNPLHKLCKTCIYHISENLSVILTF
uniref:Ovule protein n=1 Tax=Meloidogyne incognita TaxID=6306 RepID=A0A914KH30_MELIC